MDFVYPLGIIDKTALFVARNGLSFETRIVENERGNPKFSFLQITDPYRPYYDAKVVELRTQSLTGSVQQPREMERNSPTDSLPTIAPTIPRKTLSSTPTIPPPRSLDFAKLYYSTKGMEGTEEILQPPPMSILMRQIISLTALFAARNGRAFVGMVAEREATNPQFEFLKNTSILYPFFARLVEAYTRCMAPSAALILRLSEMSFQARDRALFLETDWSDFCVVERIVLPERWADAPETAAYAAPLAMNLDHFCGLPLIQQRQLITNLLLSVGSTPQQTIRSVTREETTEMSISSSSSEEEEPKIDIALKEDDAEMAISSGDEEIEHEYLPRAMALKNLSAAASTSQICPRCKQRIPISEMAEHVRLELLDPKWREQVEKHLKRSSETNLVDSSSLSQNLQRLVRERPDL
ncbi:hypothetical protein DI09_10p190 [Mitosporidium daphniae]|uniref:SURP motif domain-containing protein n=1 Tax=Mitosporidium daphniae TaxID=1485682 RepID=A0A098VVZ0_9MICR|nr:uncharacterized protein DI09_10p190 [Mitosporidium daphniae]KGG53122.1 hypothetical protein DI09_10p190 [Mitosporidium daphniae]|eukprot:XP_013239549.1 uncharacterized protein DI09_10p190 [Mitosporidium daphniae]